MKGFTYFTFKNQKKNTQVKSETDKERKTIYPNDLEKKDFLESKIKEEISNQFYDMLKKQLLTEEDSKEVTRFIKDYIKKEKYYFRVPEDYELFVSTIVNDIFGLGVLEAYIRDDTINEIWVLGPNHIWYDKQGKHIDSPIKFKNDTIVLSMANKILAQVGRKADESNPIVDARLLDGSRVCVTLPPIAEHPEIVIRKFAKYKRTLQTYLECKQISQDMADFLSTSIKWGAHIMVIGGTGSGKTSFLNALTSEIPEGDHVLTIEDSRELKVDAKFWQPWETKNANAEGVGAVTPQMLVKNSLRNSPDRIILGEIRDAVAWDVLNASMTGHKGTMTTIHAENAKEGTDRFCTLAVTAGVVTDLAEVQRMFSETFDLAVVVKKIKKDGKVLHLITQICYICGFGEKGAQIAGLDKNGKGKFENKIYLQNVYVLNEKEFKYETTGYIPKEMVQKALFENCPYDMRIFEPKSFSLEGVK
jgi:pilus assembly protein CpaF